MLENFGKISAVAIISLLSACGEVDNAATKEQSLTMDQISESYVKVILGLGEHEAGYIDAYYGPDLWATKVKAQAPNLTELRDKTRSLLAALKKITPESDLESDRINFISKQLIAVNTRVRMLGGETFTFDEETQLLFDAISPGATEADLDATLVELDALIPGAGPLSDRMVDFKKDFIIPSEKLDAVFQAAMKACHDRTAEHITLPKGESFVTEYVTDKAWGGYNWYQGNAQSLIQVNVDLPIYIDRAVDLGCHEGYPGHHVFNGALEQNLVRGKGWMEYSIYPLYSPQSLLAEGTANYGIHMAFPDDEKLKFERNVLYPLAGLNPEKAEIYEKALKIMRGLRYARTEIARRYLDGKATREEAIAWTQKYSLTSYERAEKSVRFIEQYRGYVINYTLGMDLSASYVERNGGGTTAGRWAAYEVLLSTPKTASMLKDDSPTS